MTLNGFFFHYKIEEKIKMSIRQHFFFVREVNEIAPNGVCCLAIWIPITLLCNFKPFLFYIWWPSGVFKMCSDDTIYWIFCALVTQETTIITKQEHHLKERSSMNFMWQQTPFGTISFTLNKKLQYCPGNIFIFSSIWKQQKKRFKYIHK